MERPCYLNIHGEPSEVSSNRMEAAPVSPRVPAAARFRSF